MQRVEFVEPYSQPTNQEVPDLSQVEQADIVTDPSEVSSIIRRAVTIMWRNQAFTYDELAAHLARNYVLLPESVVERDELFEQTIEQLWHREKELALTDSHAVP